MDPALGVLLMALMLVLCAGFVAIVATIGARSRTRAGSGARRRRRAADASPGIAAAALVAAAVYLGNIWWGAEADAYARYVYKPLEAHATAADDGRLQIDLKDPGWILHPAPRRLRRPTTAI